MAWIASVTKLIPLIVGAVNVVEKLKDLFKSDSSAEGSKKKQDAAVDIVTTMLEASELVIGKDIIDNAEFQVLLRRLIDDYVAIQNFVSKFNK